MTFSARLFAHGRVLRRFPGSDAARFSPRLAHGLLARIAREGDPVTLWDPVCGAGLVPAIAALFFPDAFPTVIASDLAPDAVACAARNLALVGCPDAARDRVAELYGLARRNPASARKRGEVARYLETLLPRITGAPSSTVETLTADAFRLPPRPAPIHFVGDLPYGRASVLSGTAADPAALPAALARAHPGARMTLVMTAEDARRVADDDHLTVDAIGPCRHDRAVLRAQAR